MGTTIARTNLASGALYRARSVKNPLLIGVCMSAAKSPFDEPKRQIGLARGEKFALQPP